MRIRVQWYVGSEVDWLRVYEMGWRSSWASAKTSGRKLLMEQTFDKNGYAQGDRRETNFLTDKVRDLLHPQIEHYIELVGDRAEHPMVNVIDLEFK